jgi:hypothetical protein
LKIRHKAVDFQGILLPGSVWFNDRLMPKSLFEVEHSTDFQNSLIKFSDLQDFYTRMIVVTDDSRKQEFLHKMRSSVFAEISKRVNFLG